MISIDRVDYNLPYILPNESRTLVGVLTNPANKNTLIESLFKKKLAEYDATLTSCTLSPTNIMEGYYKFLWSSIKYIALALTLNPTSNIL